MRSWRAGLPVSDRERTVSRDVAASSFSVTSGAMSLSATVSQIDPVHAPCAPIAIAAAIWLPRPMPPAASTGVSGPTASITSGQSTTDEMSPVWPPASVPWATMMSTPFSLCFSACRGAARQRGDRDAVLVRGLHHLGRRRAERVHEQRHRVLERDVHLREPGGVGPAEQVVRVPVLGQRRDVVLGEHLLHEVAVLLRDHRLELALELGRVAVRAARLFEQRRRHHEVHAVRAARPRARRSS